MFYIYYNCFRGDFLILKINWVIFKEDKKFYLSYCEEDVLVGKKNYSYLKFTFLKWFLSGLGLKRIRIKV